MTPGKLHVFGLDGRGNRRFRLVLLAAALATTVRAGALWGQQAPKLAIHWDQVTAVSKTTPTLQVVVNPQLRPGQALAAAAYLALKDLGADGVRYVPWLPYPRLAVAELLTPMVRSILSARMSRSMPSGLPSRTTP